MVQWILFFPFINPPNWPYWVAMGLALLVLSRGSRQRWLFAALGGFLLGQMIGVLALPAWDRVALFWLSAALGLGLAGLSLVAERPAVIVASFVGVGAMAYALLTLPGVGSPWNLIAFAAAGAVGVALLFMRPWERGLAVNVTLTAAGAIAGTLSLWVPYVRAWNNWPAIIIGVIAAVVGLIHQFRALPAPTPTVQPVGAPQPAA